jgi:hypothetical protein
MSKKVPLRHPKEMAAVTQPNKTTARVENNVVGQCPICHEPMPTVLANGIESYYCKRDCVSMPTPDR